jgi:hypothetical protein
LEYMTVPPPSSSSTPSSFSTGATNLGPSPPPQPPLQQWHHAMAIGLHPNSITTTLELIASMVDTILTAVDDHATTTTHHTNSSSTTGRNVVGDDNFQSGGATTTTNTTGSTRHQLHPMTFTTLSMQQQLERVSLGAIYVATELHLLSASSSLSVQLHPTHHTDTWNFLRSNIVQWDRLRQATTTTNTTNTNTTDLHTSPIFNYTWQVLQSFPILQQQYLKNAFLNSTTSTNSSSTTSTNSIFQYHTPSDLAFTISIFSSAITSGIYSLLLSPSLVSTSIRNESSTGTSTLFPSTATTTATTTTVS